MQLPRWPPNRRVRCPTLRCFTALSLSSLSLSLSLPLSLSLSLSLKDSLLASYCQLALTLASTELPYHLSKDAILKDLTSELPTWILSAYGPGKDAPAQLFGGYPMEQSFEEIRLHHMNGVLAGNVQGVVSPAPDVPSFHLDPVLTQEFR